MYSRKSFYQFVSIALVLFFVTLFNGNSFGQNNPPQMFNVKNQSGAIRVGVMMPKFTSNGKESVNAETVRSQIANYLQSPGVEIFLLGARVKEQAQLEAAANNCGYILYSNIDVKGAGSGGGMFGKLGKLGGVVGKLDLPGVNVFKQSQLKGDVSKTSNTANALGALIKEKDEVSFEYQLVVVGNPQPVATSRTKEKAAAGQDLISALIEKAVDVVIPKMFELTPPKTINTPTGTMQRQSQTQIQTQVQKQVQAPYPAAPAASTNTASVNKFAPSSSTIPFNTHVQSPVIQGVRLGMTVEEFVAQKPNLKAFAGSSYNSFGMMGNDMFTFLDGRVVKIRALYQDVYWENLDEFVSAFSQKLGLPTVWGKNRSGTPILNGNGYSLRISRGSGYDIQVIVENTAWEGVYKQRVEADKKANQTKALSANEAKKASIVF